MKRKKILILMMMINCFIVSFVALSCEGTSGETVTLFSEDFSTPISGWALNSPNGVTDWQIGAPSVGDHSGEGEALGTNIGFPYQDNTDMMIETSSPKIDLSESGLKNIELTFYHWYNFSDSLNDGGGIYLYDGSEYINPLNDYASSVSGDIATIYHILGLDYGAFLDEHGWAYDSDGTWKRVTIDISEIGLSNSDFSITFVFGEKDPDSQTGLGWYIDDISITAEKDTDSKIPPDEVPWIWIIIIGGIIGGIIATGLIIRNRGISRFDHEGGNITGDGTTQTDGTGTPTDTTPTGEPPTDGTGTPTDTTPQGPRPTDSSTPSGTGTPLDKTPPIPGTPVAIPPRIKWWRPKGEFEKPGDFNPLYSRGYEYEIWFEVPCTITPKPEQVIVAHVQITVTVQCPNNTTCTFSYDYWEAFKISEDKQALIPDKHHVNTKELNQNIKNHCPNCTPRGSYTVTRKHTVNLGTVENANWESKYNDAFAYLKNGPPPDSKASNPSTRSDATVQGSVTSFSEEGALVFEGTYSSSGFNSTYTSTLEPGTTFKYP